jgi:hypothetical protein
MARQRFSPQHDITGHALFIPEDDGAWDMERIDAEVAEMRKAAKFEGTEKIIVTEDDPGRQHVFWRYWNGDTRFDLEAEGVSEYLDQSKSPETWHLKPLSSDTRARSGRLQNGGMFHEACKVAALEALVGVENAPSEVADLIARRGKSHKGAPVTDEQLIAALDSISLGLVADLGSAAMRLSRDLSREEKKV